ncbi:uncharacterized protein V1516DRAFT_676988 [Lipomyces oligophaga]|uniref:uncharacterized protein n=1 Tax=Lipomyces oligophaga TaxID=45792 RepID=UPI0034CE3475
MNILQRSSSSLSLFDIRLYSAEHDVIVVRGTPEESAGVLVKGAIVLSFMESVSVKRISLRLYGTVRMNWQDTVQSARGITPRSNRYEKVIFEHTWNFLEWENKHVSHTLSQGNYEYPFEMVLPGSLCESVEGLDGGSVVYRMKAIVERGRFANNLVKKKHMRVVRTLGPEALELSQTMSIENVWPSKVDYSISIPSKAVPIGGATEVNLLLQPLLKGLRLGQIVIVLKEYYTLHIPHGPAHAGVRTVVQLTIPAPDQLEDEQPESVWSIRDFFAIPPSLSKCTQDCDIPGYIEVRHKLKFAISLKNPDGHVSELRASLPIALFISPHVAVSNLNSEAPVMLEPAPADVADGSAPPRYDQHIYDQLWEDIPISGFNTPSASGANTPRIHSRRNSMDGPEGLGMMSLDAQRAQLHAGLSALALTQALHGSVSPSGGPPGAGPSTDSYFPGRHSGSVTPMGHSTPLTNTLDVAGLDQTAHWHLSRGTSPHLSRGTSPIGSPLMTPSTPGEGDLDIEALSRVPSYSTALRTPLREDEVVEPPLYDGSLAAEQVPKSTRSSGPPSRASSPPPGALPRSSSAVQLNSYGQPTSGGRSSRAHFFDDAARRLKLLPGTKSPQ